MAARYDQLTIRKYAGDNEVINRLIEENWPGLEIYMVNGFAGIKPIEATSHAEAKSKYGKLYKPNKDTDLLQSA